MFSLNPAPLLDSASALFLGMIGLVGIILGLLIIVQLVRTIRGLFE